MMQAAIINNDMLLFKKHFSCPSLHVIIPALKKPIVCWFINRDGRKISITVTGEFKNLHITP